VYTYVANLDGGSYLPIGADGEPASVLIDKVLPDRDLSKSLPPKQQTRPLELSPSEAANINAALIAVSQVRVVRLTCLQPLAPRGRPPTRI
jgi:hypothetical protein